MMDKRYFPLFVDLSDKKVLVAGGGKVAERRVRSLLNFAGTVTIVSPELVEGLRNLTEEQGGLTEGLWKYPDSTDSSDHTVRWVGRKYEPEDVSGADMVLACTDDPEKNRQITADARAAGIPANNCSDQTDCDFLFPGLSVKGTVTVGITAGGMDHRLVKEIRGRTDAMLAELVREDKE